MTAVRRARALSLRKSGCTYAQIAQELQFSIPAAWKHITKALAELAAENRESTVELRDQEFQVTEVLLEAAMQKAVKGDLKAIATALKVQSRRAKCLV